MFSIKDSFPARLFYFGNLLVIGGLSTSKVVLSIGTFLVTLAGIWAWWEQRNTKEILKNPLVIMMGILFLLTCLSYFYTENTAEWANDIRIKLPLLIVPFAYISVPPLPEKQLFSLAFFFGITHTIVAALSFGRYFVVYENGAQVMMQEVALDGTIHIITKVYHIYFGLFLGFSVFWAGWWARKKTTFFHKNEFFFMWGIVLLNTIFIHLLTSRTGFLVLYAGFLLLGISILFQTKNRKWGISILAGILLLPLLAFYTLPSFRQRIDITRWDIEQYTVSHVLCDCSMAKRFFVWEETAHIIAEHPILGIGSGDLSQEILARSRSDLPKLHLHEDMNESRLLDSPHNQYMETWAGTGIFALFCLLGMLFLPFFRPGLQKMPTLQVLLLVQIALAMCTESVLKRQWGVAFVSVFILLISQHENKKP